MIKRIVGLLIIGLIAFIFIYKYNTNCIKYNLENSYIYLEKGNFNKLCNYRKEFQESGFGLKGIVLLYKSDKDFALSEIIKYKDSTNDKIELFKIYFLLNKVFGYSEKKIISKFNLNYSLYSDSLKNIDINRILLSENILTKDFDTEILNEKDLILLNVIFNIDYSLFNKINLVSDLDAGYNSIKREKNKMFFREILIKLYNSLNNKESKDIIGRFLKQ